MAFYECIFNCIFGIFVMHSMHIRKYRNFITGYLIADVLFLGARKSVFGAKLFFGTI